MSRWVQLDGELYSRSVSVGCRGEGLRGKLWGGLGWSQGSGHRAVSWGMHPTPTDRHLSPSQAIPSAPQAVISSVNETSLMLEWTPPGTREARDLVCVICKSSRRGQWAPAPAVGTAVQYAASWASPEPAHYISDLLAHTQYLRDPGCEQRADQSPFSPQFASVNITTNQAGSGFRCGLPGRALCHAVPNRYPASPALKTPSHLQSLFSFQGCSCDRPPGRVSVNSRLQQHLS